MRAGGIEKQRVKAGYVFISPWMIGFLIFTFYPLIESIIYIFYDVDIVTNARTFLGLENVRYAFKTDPYYVRYLVESLGNLTYQAPLIIIYSTFFGVVLNQRFFGRTLVRGIMFFPVIVMSGLVMSILRGDYIARELLTGNKSSNLFNVNVIQDVLYELNLSYDLVNTLTSWINNIFELSWKSGVQVVLVLSALQSISSSIYEAAQIEGASGWEIFWKISFPMITPTILINVVYTIVDSFIDLSSPTMNYIAVQQNQLRLEYASTLAWIYSLLVFVFVGIVFLVIGKRVTYINK